MFLKKRPFNQLSGVRLCMRQHTRKASQCTKAIDLTPNHVVFGKQPNKEYTQANDQVAERGNPTMNETKREEQTEWQTMREKPTNYPMCTYQYKRVIPGLQRQN